MNQPNASNAARIRTLENQVAQLTAAIELIENTRAANDQLRLAHVIENGDMALHKCSFVALSHDGGFDGTEHTPGTVTRETRTDDQTAAVAEMFNRQLPMGIEWPAFRAGIENQWFFMPLTMVVVNVPAAIETQATGDVEAVDDDLNPTGLTFAAKNICPGQMPAGYAFCFFTIHGNSVLVGCETIADDDGGVPADP